MSRWIDSFNNHAFQTVWKEIIDNIHELTVDDKTIETDVKELARFKKVVKYIDELLVACDPELIPPSIWEQFNQQTTACRDQINAFNQNRDITHLTNANSNLDNLLSYVRPYVVNAKSAAQAAGRAYKVYSDTVTQEINNLQEQVKGVVENTEKNLNNSTIIYDEINETKQKIDSFENSLFTDTEEESSFKTKTDKLYTDINDWHTKIDELHDELLIDDEEDGDSIKRQIDRAKTAILKSNKEINDKLEFTSNKISDLTKFYTSIFGVKNEETEELEGGLKRELVDRKKDLDQFKKAQEDKYEALVQEIESLLPGATSAGLATAYRVLRRKFSKPIKTYTCMFYGSILFLIFTSFIAIIDSIGWSSITFVKISNFTQLSNNLMHKLPLLLPVIWLAYFSSKRRSEADRLQQEYAHKEAIAESYLSFKIQIDALDNKDPELSKKLLGTAIEAIAFNASTTLDKKHGDKLPAQEVLENILDVIKKLPKLY